MKKALSLVLTLALAASVLAGCSGSGSAPAATTAAATTAAAAETKAEETKAEETTAAPAETTAAAPEEKPVTIKLGWAETAEEDGHPLSKAAYTFKREAEALSNGSLTIELYPAAQLGDAASLLSQVEAGTLECCMSISNGQFATSYYPDLGFLDIPYLFENADEASALLDPDSEFFQNLQADITAKTGIRPLCFFNEGLRHITNSKREIKTPEDLKGLKLRTMAVTAHMKMFEAMGASPTQVSWNELYTALQTGVVDGQENPIINAVYLSAWEVQNYMTLDGHVCLCGLFCMNDKFYNTLSDAQKEAIDTAAMKGRAAEIEMFQNNEAKALDTLKENGLQVTELTPEEIDAFRQACQPQVIEYLKGVMDTPELIDTALETVEKIREGK
jgi:C4-dicarboxylate-binding protein DctP